ncbi:Flp pilus assembly protein CpaB [Chakrabartia godavariana]|nr:Flp pilus assembly protein CpaB [Chakrabartia godavariana]
MDPKKIALLVGALIIAGVTAFMAKNMFSGSAAPQAAAAVQAPQPVGPKILVATRALPIGTIIGPDSFRYQPWPQELMENAYFVEGQNVDLNKLNGTVVRTAISAGQPITQGALVKPGDRGFLAAALGPGMRAVTVSVSAQSGVAGFVFPGDRVDIVLTQTVDGSDGPALRTSETIIRNVRVLATDQRTTTEDKDGNTEVKVSSNVTLEVTPRIAEKIAVAQSIGQISLSLRSIADNASELERAIASGDVRVPEGADPKSEKQMLLAIASRPVDSDTTFVTGADVSRFQRRSVPRATAPTASAGNGAAPAGGATVDPANRGPVVKVWRSATPTEVTFGGK